MASTTAWSTLPTGRGIGTGVPVSIAWNAATDVGSGVASYELQRSVDGGAWATMPKATAGCSRSTILTMPRNRTYQFQVRAVDAAGNAGDGCTTGAFRLAVAQETTRALTFVKGTWSKTTSPSYDGHGARSTRTTGGIARFTFTGSTFAWVSARSPVRGAAGVYVNGVLAGNVDTYSTSTAARLMVFSKTWTSSARRTVEIRVAGTSGHPRVDLDAFVVLTPVAGATPPPAPAATPTPTPPPAATPTPTPNPTPAPAASGNVLIGAGDIASCGLTGDAATAKLVAAVAGTVFTAGDNAYEIGQRGQVRQLLRPDLGRVLRADLAERPGNHEYGTSGASWLLRLFRVSCGVGRAAAGTPTTSAPGASTRSTRTAWWWAVTPAGHRSSGCGRIWRRNPRPCVLAYWHHPRFSSGEHGNDAEVAPFWNALYEAGAEVIVNGHDHDYERFAQQTPAGASSAANGIRQFVVGTGGASLRGFGTIKANSQVRSSSAHGVLKLTLTPTSYAGSSCRSPAGPSPTAAAGPAIDGRAPRPRVRQSAVDRANVTSRLRPAPPEGRRGSRGRPAPSGPWRERRSRRSA